MADEQEKTEAPSAHKLEKAKQEGNVAKSPEVSGVIIMFVGLAVLFFLFPFWLEKIRDIYVYIIAFPKEDFTKNDVVNVFWMLVSTAGIMLLPIFWFWLSRA